uniref:Alternative protein TAF1D n=1 Tax=Homo sapiens TaxID=9606 RepID=L8ECK2_HUMAN|nr:alternative protein TAF1D [Homo sapiens]
MKILTVVDTNFWMMMDPFLLLRSQQQRMRMQHILKITNVISNWQGIVS